MVKKSNPKRGSKQFWPRKRANKWTAKVGSWDSKVETKEAEVSVLGFPGFKVGMTHIGVIDNFPKSLSKGTQISYPVTILECPPVIVYSLKLYKYDERDNLQIAKEVVANIKDKEVLKHFNLGKRKAKLESLEKLNKIIEEEDIVDIRIRVITKPFMTSIGKKKADNIELGLSGNLIDRLKFAYEKLGTELRVSDVVNSGEQVDTHGITTGKGFQGTVKRFGTNLTSIKSEKSRRHAGNVGGWTPARVMHTTPLAGQMGFHLRTEYNKWVLKVGSDVEELNSSAGFNKYGLMKNDYVLVKGSIQGTKKRMITMVKSIRPNSKFPKIAPEITYINKK